MAVVWTGWMRYMFGGLWNPDKGLQRSGPGGYVNDALQTVTDDRALMVSAVFRSVRLLAETCASLPLRGWQRTGSGDQKPLKDSHWLNQLIEEPNPEMTGEEYREACFAQMAGWGNSYSEIVPNDAGRAVELWPYKVDRMKVERLDNRSLKYTYPDTLGVPAVLPSGRTLHVRMFTVDGVMGISPLGMARESLGLIIGADRYAASFFANGGRPSGVLTSDRLLGDKQREQIRHEFGGLAEGGQDSKRFWVLEAALKYQPITVNPEDMQMLQTRTFSVEEVARFFGIPPFLLGATAKSTSWGTGLEQQNLAFLAYTLRAYLERMETIYNRRLVPAANRGDLFVEFDTTPLLRTDSTARTAFYSGMSQNGIMTRNECRKLEKLPKNDSPGADVLTCQVNLTTLDKIIAAPAAAAGDAAAGPGGDDNNSSTGDPAKQSPPARLAGGDKDDEDDDESGLEEAA